MSQEILWCDKEDDGQIYTHLTLGVYSYRAYGILIADIIRHVAIAYNVRPEDVLDWVNRELVYPTTSIKRVCEH